MNIKNVSKVAKVTLGAMLFIVALTACSNTTTDPNAHVHVPYEGDNTISNPPTLTTLPVTTLTITKQEDSTKSTETEEQSRENLEYTFYDGNSSYITILLASLNYSEDICVHDTEYHFSTMYGEYDINLTQRFARNADNQIGLTEGQIDIIQRVIDSQLGT